MDPESPELLALLLKKIPALQPKLGGEQFALSKNISQIKLIDAMWVWTEPNCKRLKARLTIRASIDCSPGTVQIQQRVLVEFHVKFSQCKECNREFTNRTWHALVQLRQKRTDGNRKGLVLLEMALAKNAEIRKHVLRVVTTKNGFDFYFLEYSHAQQFASFLSRISPLRSKTSKKMVSEDVKNNTANMKYTISADMVPLCRDDLVVCCKNMGIGSMVGKLVGRMALVTKVTSCVHLVDATPVRGMLQDAFADLHPDKYWKGGGKGVQFVLSSERLERFVVLDVELCDEDKTRNGHRHGDGEHPLYRGPHSGIDKYALADVEVVKESDFGNNETFRCVTHLGNLLNYGDIVLGYDLTTSVLPEELFNHGSSQLSSTSHSHGGAFINNFIMPDVVLVKKIQGSIDGESNANTNIQESESKQVKLKGKGKAKSSASKKRERRLRKQQRKELEMERTAARMGFTEDEEINLDQQSAALEMNFKHDPELQKDLELFERELALAKIDEKEAENATDTQEEQK